MKFGVALRVYGRNYVQKRSSCTFQGLRNLLKKFKDTGCMCDKTLSGWPTVSVDNVVRVHYIVASGDMETAKGTARKLCIPKTMVLKLLHTVLHMYQSIQMLQTGDQQQRINIANEFLIRFHTNSNCPLFILRTDEVHLILNGMKTPNIVCSRQARILTLRHKYFYYTQNLVSGAALQVQLFLARTALRKRY